MVSKIRMNFLDFLSIDSGDYPPVSSFRSKWAGMTFLGSWGSQHPDHHLRKNNLRKNNLLYLLEKKDGGRFR
jgi:hypothetical protein